MSFSHPPSLKGAEGDSGEGGGARDEGFSMQTVPERGDYPSSSFSLQQLGAGEEHLFMAAAGTVDTARGGVHIPKLDQVQVCLLPLLPSQSEEYRKRCSFP